MRPILTYVRAKSDRNLEGTLKYESTTCSRQGGGGRAATVSVWCGQGQGLWQQHALRRECSSQRAAHFRGSQQQQWPCRRLAHRAGGGAAGVQPVVALELGPVLAHQAKVVAVKHLWRQMAHAWWQITGGPRSESTA